MSTDAVTEILRLAEANAAEQQDGRRSWQRVDLTDVLDGTYRPPRPTVGARADGAGLFYPGREHTLSSESEAGKTWVALAAALVELDAGNAVVYIDFEDDEGGIVGRLLAMGASPGAIRDRFAYIRPERAINALGNREDLAEVLADLNPTLAILDGVTEAMAMHGLEMRDNTDVARFAALLPRWIANRGAASVSLDHVTKDRDTRGRYSIGGVHKLNGLNGAAYLLESRTPFGIGLTGRSTVKLAKDRPGALRQTALPSGGGLHWFADLVVHSHDAGFVEVSLAAPEPDGGRPFRPTHLMEKVSDALTRAPEPLSVRGVLDRVTGNAEATRKALACLIDEGFVQVENGARGAHLHRLLMPFTEAGE